MLALEIRDFMIEMKDGTINNIGGPTKQATAKLFDVNQASARAFGDNRIKLECADEEGNEVQIALLPEQIEAITADLQAIREAETVEGFESGSG